MTRVLTSRERQVLDLASRGLTSRQIAEELGIAYPTARTHMQNILNKTHSTNRTEAAVKYERERAAFEARERLSEAIQKWVRTTHRTLDAPKEASA